MSNEKIYKNLNNILLKEIINNKNDFKNYLFDKNVNNNDEFNVNHINETLHHSGIITPGRLSPPITRSRKIVRIN